MINVLRKEEAKVLTKIMNTNELERQRLRKFFKTLNSSYFVGENGWTTHIIYGKNLRDQRLDSSSRIHATWVHYKMRHALTRHINTRVRRRRQDISMMKIYLMHLFSTTFQLTINISILAYTRRHPGGRSITKGFSDSLNVQKSLRSNYFGHVKCPNS